MALDGFSHDMHSFNGSLPYNIGIPYIILEMQTSTDGPGFQNWSEWQKIESFDSITLRTSKAFARENLNATYTLTFPETR